MLRKILKTGNLKLLSYRKQFLRHQHKITYLFWECTLNCNFYCQHCGSNAGKKVFKDELNTSEIKFAFKDIAQAFNAKQIMLAITGGEPLLRKDLFEVMAYTSQLGFSWGMVTNGYLINREVIKKMKQSGMKTIVISIDGIGSQHDDFRGVEGAYEKAINGIKLLAKENFLTNLQITTTIHKGNINLLEEMYKEFTSLKINSWRLLSVAPIGRAEINRALLLNNKELKKLLDFIKEKRKLTNIDITYGCEGFLGLDYEGEVRSHYYNCTTGINIGSILHNGDIFVCPNVPRVKEFIQGNVKNNKFSEVWNNKFQIFRDKNRNKCDKCIKCEYWEECLGNSFHLWDFDKREPKICHLQMLS